ncbi:hypothetical protein B0H13DRAFT_1880478 [Mycena leptocephala]|nr:hypothetical protein B0H13DRAFT_1880478 [Mycena leptocephala]
MTDHAWLPLGLSSRAKALSGLVADLRRSLPAELLGTNAVTRSKLELLESEIFALRTALIPPNSFHASHVDAIPGFAYASSLAIKQLVQHAHETLWDELPLHAILKAHKSRAKELTDADEDGQHSAEIYVAYYKYLQLRNPGSKDNLGPEYREFLHLERSLCAGSGTKMSPNGNIKTQIQEDGIGPGVGVLGCVNYVRLPRLGGKHSSWRRSAHRDSGDRYPGWLSAGQLIFLFAGTVEPPTAQVVDEIMRGINKDGVRGLELLGLVRQREKGMGKAYKMADTTKVKAAFCKLYGFLELSSRRISLRRKRFI